MVNNSIVISYSTTVVSSWHCVRLCSLALTPQKQPMPQLPQRMLGRHSHPLLPLKVNEVMA